jgi:hypothetical protein
MAADWTPVRKNWKSLIDALLQSSSSASPFGLDELADDLSDISPSLDVQQALLHIEAIYQLASEFERTTDPRYARVSRFRKLFESSSFLTSPLLSSCSSRRRKLWLNLGGETLFMPLK